jgi:hypothetical protein
LRYQPSKGEEYECENLQKTGELFPFTPVFPPLTPVFRPLTGFCFAETMNDAKWFVLKKLGGDGRL